MEFYRQDDLTIIQLLLNQCLVFPGQKHVPILQIIGGFEDNFEIISVVLHKTICSDPSLELPH